MDALLGIQREQAHQQLAVHCLQAEEPYAYNGRRDSGGCPSSFASDYETVTLPLKTLEDC